MHEAVDATARGNPAERLTCRAGLLSDSGGGGGCAGSELALYACVSSSVIRPVVVSGASVTGVVYETKSHGSCLAFARRRSGIEALTRRALDDANEHPQRRFGPPQRPSLAISGAALTGGSPAATSRLPGGVGHHEVALSDRNLGRIREEPALEIPRREPEEVQVRVVRAVVGDLDPEP